MTDAAVALGRISTYLLAEELDEPFLLNEDSKYAVEIKGGEFTWEVVGGLNAMDGKDGKKSGKKDTKSKGKSVEKEKKGLKSRLFKKKGEEKKDGLPIHSSGSSVTAAPSPSPVPDQEDEKPFALDSLDLRIPKNSFVAIVGRVGTGKSSLLQAMIGEMRKTAGEVVLGGTIAYVPQSAWIMNASLKQNVLFGQEDDEER